MSVSDSKPATDLPTPADAEPVVEHSAFKPLLYILILPMAVIVLLQWSGLPAMCVHALTGH